MKVALISNIPAPYRVPVFNRVARELGDDFLAVFCARLEPNRQWDLGSFAFNHLYLKENFNVRRGAFIHNNPDVVGVLRRFGPDAVITTGFNPTALYAWGYSLLSGARHLPMTDGWAHSERVLGLRHKLARRLVFRTSEAFIGAGRNSLELYRKYGIAEADLFLSHLCIDNERFTRLAGNAVRPYDLMYSGQIIERKMPDFFVDVVCRVKEARGAARVLVIGDGPLRERMLAKLADSGAEVDYAGFVAQGDLPGHYCRAKLLLFTTNNDPWGIIANEALASGTPVITSPYSGVAHDLVIEGRNGYVVETDVAAWADKAVELLDNSRLWEEMSSNAVRSVHEFTFDNAARGIIAAAKWACSRAGAGRSGATPASMAS